VKAHVPNSFPSPANRQFLKVRRERLTPAEADVSRRLRLAVHERGARSDSRRDEGDRRARRLL